MGLPIFSNGHQWENESSVLTDERVVENFQLTVWNDDVNTFDWVIESLMDICNHTLEQAEQCALFIHFKGKYVVKSGPYEVLEPKNTALLDRGIQSSIGL